MAITKKRIKALLQEDRQGIAKALTNKSEWARMGVQTGSDYGIDIQVALTIKIISNIQHEELKYIDFYRKILFKHESYFDEKGKPSNRMSQEDAVNYIYNKERS